MSAPHPNISNLCVYASVRFRGSQFRKAYLVYDDFALQELRLWVFRIPTQCSQRGAEIADAGHGRFWSPHKGETKTSENIKLRR